ncbi:MAG TPA: protein kinase [Thermoanaerobaculia bacterium]|nr:protein kinase [Thermoanaerobaculia bacterium]
MTLAAGTRLGPYEILSPLGAGGMGEVYRARDKRLGREVAVKVLPERMAEDADALARFEREAKAVAGLSHPNILALHDFGREGSVAYAVMELLEGETLGEALQSGPLSARRATDYAVQMALGLAAAHEKGIVHRDLKPDNVFVTRDERIKLLDFGLAKATAADWNDPSATHSPTVSGYTEPGRVLGTVGYMSPEQVRGLPLDHRSDIFSFGSVLYEMATGRRAFRHETAAETMTAILKEEPLAADGAAGGVPAALAAILRHCLEKKPEKRFQSARDLAFALETAAAPSAASPALAATPRRSTPWTRLGLAALAVAAAAAGYLLRPGPATTSAGADWQDMTFTRLTTDPGYEGEPTFSPDGRTIAYVSDRDGNFEIYLQQISGGPAINLTQNPAADIQPAFSPDGREIAFVSSRSGSDILHAAPGLPHVGGDIWVMPALGGPARKIVENGTSPSWTPDGADILYEHGSYRSARIARVPATGGQSRDIPIDEPFTLRYFFPKLSDDGRWLLYQNGYSVEVVAAQGGKPKVLVQGEYPAWGPGSASILFTNDLPGKGRTLWTAPFSGARGELAGPSRPLTFGRGPDIGAAASRDGTAIAFTAADESLNLEEIPFDAEAGRVTGPPRELTAGNNAISFIGPSPDGKAVAFAASRGGVSHIWRVDAPAPPIELTRDSGVSDSNPAWSPDGREIAFSRQALGAGSGSSDLWLMNADGTSPRRVTEMVGAGAPAWMPDGKSILISHGDSLLRLDMPSGRTTTVPWADARTLFVIDASGQWVAFQTHQGNSLTVAAVPIAGGTPRDVISSSYEAFHPSFAPSGRWLYFQMNHKNLFRVPGPAQDWKSATPEKVTDFSGVDLYIEDPKISTDGTKLFYTRGRTTGDIIILRMEKPKGKK